MMESPDDALDDAEIVPIVVPVAPDDPDLNLVFAAAVGTLQTMVGATLDAITVRSIDPTEARLLGDNVSKFSPLTSTLLEHRTVTDLARATEGEGSRSSARTQASPTLASTRTVCPLGMASKSRRTTSSRPKSRGGFEHRKRRSLVGRSMWRSLHG